MASKKRRASRNAKLEARRAGFNSERLGLLKSRAKLSTAVAILEAFELGFQDAADTGRCLVYEKSCADHGFIHGAEASELREGIEELIKQYSDCDRDGDCAGCHLIEELEALLEKVDARDSVARQEAQLPKGPRAKTLSSSRKK